MTKQEALQRFLDIIHDIQWMDDHGLHYTPRWHAAQDAAMVALEAYRKTGATNEDIISLGLGAHTFRAKREKKNDNVQ